jgi:hypothetical protein
MLKAWAKAVEPVWKSYAQTAGLCTVSTASRLFAYYNLSFIHHPSTAFAQLAGLFAQPKRPLGNLLSSTLYPVSTRPNVITNLIKE